MYAFEFADFCDTRDECRVILMLYRQHNSMPSMIPTLRRVIFLSESVTNAI
jgi:hypothetical protein